MDERKSAGAEYYDVRFEDYRGKKRYEVKHPEHKDALVAAAPDFRSAIVAAAARWGEKWTRYGFYAYCSVRQIVGG